MQRELGHAPKRKAALLAIIGEEGGLFGRIVQLQVPLAVRGERSRSSPFSGKIQPGDIPGSPALAAFVLCPLSRCTLYTHKVFHVSHLDHFPPEEQHHRQDRPCRKGFLYAGCYR